MKLIRPRARTARLLAALSSIAALAPLTLASGTAARATAPPTYLFVNENPKGPNEVRSYSVNSAGTTTLVGTYSTGHPGSTSSYVASERADTARTAGHLYALNLGDQTLSIFSIDAATGALTLQTTTSPIGATAIAVNPAGTVLYAAGSANEGSLDQLSAYLIASDGTIGASPVSSVAASVDGIAVSPDGTEVATANPGGNQFTTGVELWSADSKGNLAATSTVTAACPTDVRFSPDSTVLYATACASGQLTAYSITAGTLSATAASQVSSQSLAVAPDGTVFVSTASGLTGEVDAAGSFTADPATSYPALSTVTSMTVSPDGTRLFVASFATGSVSDYSIGTGGTLSLLEQIPVLPGLPTVVAYNPVQVPQTITFGSVPSSEPYGTPLTVTATGGGSGHPVTFSAAGGSSCVVSDNGNGTASVTTTGVGTCTILAGQAGGPGYLDGAATASVQVTPAPLTVTASPASQVYGSANPPLTATLSGFVNGDTAASATSGAAACTTTAVATSPVGNYPVNCSIGTLAAINYTFSTFVPAILTVTPAPLSVSADPQSRSYGAANPALTVSFSGFANTDTATTAVTGSPDCTTPATASSPVGAYPITCSVGTLAAANYSIAAVGPSSLTVSPGGLTVTANSQAMVYGSPVPALTATVTGFVNGDTAASAVTGAPVCTTAATSTSPTGTYPITCTTGTLGATNYTFGMFVAGTLTVTPAVLTVTANAQTQVYGGATPPLSTILSGFVAGDGPAVVSGSPSCSTTAIASSPVGPYPITCATGTLSATNYTFASVPGTLTVLPAPLTLVAGDRTASYGAPVVNLGAALTGFVNGDPPSVVTGTPLCSTAAMPTSSVGAYPITCTVGSLNAQNYAITASTAGTYTVTPAALTVTPDAQSMVYGSPAPPLTYTISGFVNGESQASATTGSALCQATVSPTSPVGSYPITCSAGTLQAANYDFTTFDQSSLSVTPAPLTVTAVSVAATYGAALPAPSWTITGFLNGDTAPSATTGSPSCSSSAGTTSGVAQYPITCTQGTLQASNNYTLGSFVPGVLTIGPATLTVAADSQARMYGQPNPGLTATVTGFVNGDPPSVVSGSPSCTTDAVASSPVGSYQITCVTTGMSAANYVFGAPLSGTLTVTQGGLTITAKSYDTTYGSPVAAPTATISGFVNGDTTATATTGTPACTTTATAASPVGTYPITCTIGTLASQNYTFGTFVAGTVVITPAPLTVSANPASTVYGAGPPALTATISGFVNGDTAATATTGTPACTTTATAASPVGTYPITCTIGTLAGANYSVQTFPPSTLTVTPAPLTVTAASQSRAYGGANPVLNASVTGFVNGDTSAVLSGSPVCSTTAVATSPVGGYPITCSIGSLAAQNYVVSGFVTGRLTVTPALLTITANDQSKLFGTTAVLAATAFTATGLRNADTVTAVTLTSAGAAASAAVGAYPIVPSAAVGTGLSNYTIRYLPGSLYVYVGGVVGLSSVWMGGNSLVDSYDSANGPYGGANTGSSANVMTNALAVLGSSDIDDYQQPGAAQIRGNLESTLGVAVISRGSSVTGNVTAGQIVANSGTVGGTIQSFHRSAAIGGSRVPGCSPPSSASGLTGSFTYRDGTLSLAANATVALAAGSYCFENIFLSPGSSLTVSGPVSVTVLGEMSASGASVNAGGRPTDFQLQVAAWDWYGGGLYLSDGTYDMSVYAPNATALLSGHASFSGDIIAGELWLTDFAAIHYDIETYNAWAGMFGIVHRTSWYDW